MTDSEKEELRRSILEELYKNDLPAHVSPVGRPVDRFAHLNPELRRMLGELSAEDAHNLKDALRLYRTVHTISRFLRWAFLLFLAALVGGAAIGDHIVSIWKAIFGGPK